MFCDNFMAQQIQAILYSQFSIDSPFCLIVLYPFNIILFIGRIFTV
jgi:hypothetical protein